MSDLVILVPRQDFMRQTAYDLLDAILTSSGFCDEGVITLSEYAFRQYALPDENLARLAPFTDQFDYRKSDETIAVYAKDPLDEGTQIKLCSYGFFPSGLASMPMDVLMWQYAIDAKNLPRLARLAPNGIRASRRYLEESSYYKWVENGCRQGHDLADWFAAEWSADERIQMHLKSME